MLTNPWLLAACYMAVGLALVGDTRFLRRRGEQPIRLKPLGVAAAVLAWPFLLLIGLAMDVCRAWPRRRSRAANLPPSVTATAADDPDRAPERARGSFNALVHSINALDRATARPVVDAMADFVCGWYARNA